MPKHDDRVSIQQILDHALEAVNMVEGKAFKDLINERMLELALVRLLEITGEAASRVSKAAQTKYAEIPCVISLECVIG